MQKLLSGYRTFPEIINHMEIIIIVADFVRKIHFANFAVLPYNQQHLRSIWHLALVAIIAMYWRGGFLLDHRQRFDTILIAAGVEGGSPGSPCSIASPVAKLRRKPPSFFVDLALAFAFGAFKSTSCSVGGSLFDFLWWLFFAGFFVPSSSFFSSPCLLLRIRRRTI
jgi:hypothetical protein